MEVRARFSLDVTKDYEVVAQLDESTTYGEEDGEYSIYQIVAAFEHAVAEFYHYLKAALYLIAAEE